MKIGIEFRQITLGGSGGITPHVLGVLNSLFRNNPQQSFFVYCTFFNRELFPDVPANVRVYSLPLANYFKHEDEKTVEDQIDVLFRPYPIEEQLNFPAERQIFLIPDMQHDAYPEFFNRELLRTRRASFHFALARAGAIGTLTNFSLQSIWASPWCHCDDIFLMPPALQFSSQEQADKRLSTEEEAVLPQGDFFYFPANLWKHKNHRRTIQAFEKFLKSTGANIELILTGHPAGWETLRTEFPGLPVRHLGFVSAGVVRQLYRQAKALVFFSLYEGFGMPLLEAFDAGIPVLCSNTTSLPEVGQNAVLSCDPIQTDEMARLMEQVYLDESLRQKLIQRGRQVLSTYTWEGSAENLMAACKRVQERANSAQRTIGTEMPLVTIVTPSYNQGRFLRRTIESVLNQTYQNIEYIVMDGGSTDESVEILKSYGDQFTWKSERDKGQANAINKGMRLAKGEILAFLNSDDTLLPDGVAKAVEAFQTNPELDMLYGDAYYTDENDQVTGEYATDDFSFTRLLADNCICQPAAFWKRRIANIVGEFDESYHTAMDHDYWCRIYLSGGIIKHLHKHLACSRIYSETKTMSMREKVYEEIFRLSRQHTGVVSLSYYYGLWHYRIWESNGRWRSLRRLPGSFYVAGQLHQHWDQRKNAKRNIINFTLGKIGRVRNRLSIHLPVVHKIASRVRRQRYGVTQDKPVLGFYADNWMGPEFQVRVSTKIPGQALVVRGSPVVDTQLVVMVENTKVASYDLSAGCPYLFEVPAKAKQRVRFSFSNDAKLPDGRYISFFVEGTNLFSEQEAFG